ncbi:hypothetical protein JXI42_12345 [bacterium]|nr:hypothetical protein [bacterium]
MQLIKVCSIFFIICAWGSINTVHSTDNVELEVICTNSTLNKSIDKAAQIAYYKVQDYFDDFQQLGKITIKVVESDKEFYDYMGDGFPDWGVGVALPDENAIVMKSPDLYNYPHEFDEVLTHEMGHLLLHQKLNGADIPRWFDEGFAQMVSTSWSLQQMTTMTLAVWGNNIIPLDHLETVNQFDQAKAKLAYTESFSTVLYIYQKAGKTGFNKFLETIHLNSDFERGFYAATGYTIKKFSELWQNDIKNKYHWAFLINDPRFIYFIMLALFLLALVVKLIKKYKLKRELEETHYHSNYEPPLENGGPTIINPKKW